MGLMGLVFSFGCDDAAPTNTSLMGTIDAGSSGTLRDARTDEPTPEAGTDSGAESDGTVEAGPPPVDLGTSSMHACNAALIGQAGRFEGQNDGVSSTNGTCGGNGPETVIEFTAPEDGRWRFDADGSMGTVALYVRSTCLERGTEVACALTDGADPRVEVLLNARQRVFVFLDSVDDPDAWVLTISKVVREDCDDSECAPGEGQCTDEGLLQTCGDADGDGCLEWLPPAACGEDEICEQGECASCEGLDLQNDPNHCGACGFVCAGDNATSRCEEGLCVLDCDAGFGDCDADPENGCETDVTGPDRCGSCAILEAAPGSPCGTCDSGVYVCNGPDAVICQGDRGVDATNACGGCGELPFEVGSACGTCGSGLWGCDADGRLTCVDDRGDAARNACGGCAELENPIGGACGPCEDGIFECLGRDLVTCVGDTPANQCGGCQPLQNPPGQACGTCALDQYVCGENPNETVCDGNTINVCGGCGDIDFGADLLGSACGTCNSGRWGCSDEERIICEGDLGGGVENECGGCAALEYAVGTPCGPCLLDRYICAGSDAVACDGNTECPVVECELEGNIGTRRITRVMSPCLVLADATLAEGDTLTIDAGVVFKFAVSTDWNDDVDLIINGDLQANGSDESPIIFTSLRDDTAAGDVNDDDVEELQPARGDWGRVRIFGRGRGRLSNVHMRYGGGGNDGNCCAGARASAATLEINSEIAPQLEKIRVEQSQLRGAQINISGGFEWAVQGGEFVDNGGIGLDITGQRAPIGVSDVTARGNGADGVRLNSQGDQTLNNLTVQGNAANGLSITSGGILTLTDSDISDHPNHFNLVIANAAANSQVRRNTIEASDAVFAEDHEYVVSVIPNLVQEVADNNVLLQTSRGFYVRAGRLEIDATWPNMGYEYVVTSGADVHIDADSTLTLEPGVVLKFPAVRDWNNDGDFNVYGRLDAVGEPNAPITFTSRKDDAYGGDTNGDGLGSDPAPGDWGRLVFHAGSEGQLDHVNLRYGGGGNDGNCCAGARGTDATLSISDEVPPQLSNLDIAYSQARGAHIRVTGGEDWGLTDSRFHHNAGQGLHVVGENAGITLADTTFDANGGDGLQVTSTGRVSLTELQVQGNGNHGVSVNTTGALAMRENAVEDHPSGVGLYVANASAESTLEDNVIAGARIVAKVVPNVVDPLTHGNDLRDTDRGVYVLSGAVTTEALWPAEPYAYVLEYGHDLTVAAAAHLTLEPGVVMKMSPVRDWNNDGDITVNGRLDAVGTPEAPIVFTSLNDDTFGGDTNGDDQDSGPAAGDWGRLRFAGDGTGALEHVTLQFGGGGNDGNCCAGARGTDATLSIASDVPPTMTQLAIRHSQARGAYVGVTGGQAWGISNTIFADNGSHGLEVRGENAPFGLDQVTAENNAGHGMVLHSTGEQRLSLVEVRGNRGDGVHVNTTGALLMDNTDISDHPRGTGLTVTNASPTSEIDGNLIAGAAVVARLAPNVVDPVTHGNELRDTDRGIVVLSGTLSSQAVWPSLGIEYVVAGSADITIGNGAHLTLEAGTVVKMPPVRDWNNDSDWVVNGRLDLVGTPEDPIVFTSLWDDDFGGDTNGDGVDTAPAAGDWGRIAFSGGATGTVQHVSILYGGGGNDGNCCAGERAGGAALSINAAVSPAIDDVTVLKSRSTGIAFNVNGGEAWSTSNLTIRDNMGVGLTIGGGNATVTVSTSEIGNNDSDGVTVSTTGDVVFNENRVSGNGRHGLSVSTTGGLSAAQNVFSDHFEGIGLVVTGADYGASVIAGNTIVGNQRPIRTFPNLVETTVRNNDVRDVNRGVQVDGGTLNIETTWPATTPYVLTGSLNIAAEGHLTLEGGVLLKLATARDWRDDLDIDVHGGLTTQGDDGVVRITALNHDLGGDTNGDGVASLPAPGDWGRISARAGSTLELAGTEISYGGGGNDGNCCAGTRPTDAILSIGGGEASVRNTFIHHSAADGIRITGGAGRLAANELTDNVARGLRVSAAVCAAWEIADQLLLRNGEANALAVCP